MTSETTLEYWYADPTGNITLLVEGSYAPEQHAAIAGLLLAAEPRAEQVGFLTSVSSDKVSLRMAGDEFCGNAALSSAAVSLEASGAFSGTLTVDVFGLSGSLRADLCRSSGHCYSGCIEMPSPLEISEQVFSLSGQDHLFPVVRFPGICHILCTRPLDKASAEESIRSWCHALDAPALGIMQLDLQAGRLLPLVYVQAVYTLYWESSCASGTCAAVSWLSAKSGGDASFRFSEPGGTLGARIEQGRLYLSGTVALEKKTLSIPAERKKPL